MKKEIVTVLKHKPGKLDYGFYKEMDRAKADKLIKKNKPHTDVLALPDYAIKEDL